MKFTDSSAVEQVVWQLKLADYPRAQNRALINELFNGMPPYTEDEVRDNNIATNVNFLQSTKVAHDARSQFNQAFLVPDPLFSIDVDYGPSHKRQEYSSIITKEANRIVKGSLFYMETQRSTIAQNVMHGIAPTSWADSTSWCPRSDGVEDILIPSNTLCSLENLPFFAKFRSYTARELWDKTHGPMVDPGWNIELVESAVKWIDGQAQALLGNSWPEVWSPEKMEERVKQDGGLYAADAVPTVDVYDFFYWDDSDGRTGWRRKMVLDAWGFPGVGGSIRDIQDIKTDRSRYGMERSQFLYDSEQKQNPVYADKLEHIVHFQFADCSSVGPFRYHSVRSLGFMLYSVCHLENRLRCKFNDAVFESLMQYFRVNNMADAERAMKIDLTDKRPLPDGIQFVRPEERWKVDERLIQMAMQSNQQTISNGSQNFIHSMDSDKMNAKSASETISREAQSASMISAMLNQAYLYKAHQYREICRRLCMSTETSQDTDANKFRSACVRQGVPIEALCEDYFDIEPTKIMGAGNKVLQSAMMDKIMLMYYPKLDPSSQREALRQGLAITIEDYSKAARWVPDQPVSSGSKHDAQLSAGVLLSGLPMDFKQGVNHDEYAQTLLVALQVKVQQIQSRGIPITQDELIGIQNLAGMSIQGQPVQGGNGIHLHIEVMQNQIPQNIKGHPDVKSSKEKVKAFADQLSKLMNQVKAMAQQAAEAAKKSAQSPQGGQQIDPKDQAKINAMIMVAKTKAQLASESHAQRTAQRQIQWEMEQKRGHKHHVHEMSKDMDRHNVEILSSHLKAMNAPQKPE
ncbi:MAG: hypothetical protein WCI55_08075 [Armatimonadota bacterium]